MMGLPYVPPEFARAQARDDLDVLYADGVPERYGWIIEDHELETNGVIRVAIPTRRADGSLHPDGPYHHRLEFSHYPVFPPAIEFVNPATGRYNARTDSHWIPLIGQKPVDVPIEYFTDHGGSGTQLVCHSLNSIYYVRGGHRPPPHLRWDESKHNLRTVLFLHDQMLREPYYGGKRPGTRTERRRRQRQLARQRGPRRQ